MSLWIAVLRQLINEMQFNPLLHISVIKLFLCFLTSQEINDRHFLKHRDTRRSSCALLVLSLQDMIGIMYVLLFRCVKVNQLVSQ